MSKILWKPGTFVYPIPAVLVSSGTMEESNLITVAWTGILNTNPASQRGNYRLVINLENPITSDTDLIKIKLKIKDDVQPGTYQSVMVYKLFNIFATETEGKLELDRKSYPLTISERTQTGNDTNNPVITIYCFFVIYIG